MKQTDGEPESRLRNHSAAKSGFPGVIETDDVAVEQNRPLYRARQVVRPAGVVGRPRVERRRTENPAPGNLPPWLRAVLGARSVRSDLSRPSP